VLDLVNPVGAGRRLLGWGRQAGFNEARPVGGKPLTLRSINIEGM
jgi:hypothetical protein